MRKYKVEFEVEDNCTSLYEKFSTLKEKGIKLMNYKETTFDDYIYKECEFIYRVKKKFAFNKTFVHRKKCKDASPIYKNILFKFYYEVEYRQKVSGSKWKSFFSGPYCFIDETDAYNNIESIYKVHNNK